MPLAVISGSKVKILKVNHNFAQNGTCSSSAVISGSKVKILKVNHNGRQYGVEDPEAVISGSKVKILKVNHNVKSPYLVKDSLLSLAQR